MSINRTAHVERAHGADNPDTEPRVDSLRHRHAGGNRGRRAPDAVNGAQYLAAASISGIGHASYVTYLHCGL